MEQDKNLVQPEEQGKELKAKAQSVNKEQLEKLLKTVEEQGKRIEILTQAADKGRMFWAENQNKKTELRRVKVTTIGGKFVLAWRTVKDIVEKNPLSGVWSENQEYEFIFADDTRLPVVGYNKFAELQYGAKVESEVLSRKENADGSVVLEVKLPDGRTVEVDSRFVN